MKDTFEEALKQVKASLKDLISSDTPKEQLEKITSIDKTIDEMSKSHSSLVEEHSSLKDTYIEVVKNTGFKTSSEDKQPNENRNSLEDIISEVISKRH